MPTAVAIITATAAEFSVPLPDVLGRRRLKREVVARQAAMFLARELTGLTLPQIGNAFAHRDHTTILHGIARTIERARDPAFNERLDRIRLYCAARGA